ncbi:hypothetical protein [Nannocystis pusilla]|uniref:hypothetical protein n=1 Tax=Nannocystis pusilla TaxID=889268 RepID=UPI003B79587A
MKLRGRILWLTDDPHGIAKQLTGTDLDARADAAPPLHYGVNTDLMISGAACTLGYTGDILGPYFLENFKEQVQRTASRTAASRSSSAVTPTDPARAARSPWSPTRAPASSSWWPAASSGSSRRTWSTAACRSPPTSG